MEWEAAEPQRLYPPQGSLSISGMRDPPAEPQTLDYVPFNPNGMEAEMEFEGVQHRVNISITGLWSFAMPQLQNLVNSMFHYSQLC